jgi:hypothetical protein
MKMHDFKKKNRVWGIGRNSKKIPHFLAHFFYNSFFTNIFNCNKILYYIYF